MEDWRKNDVKSKNAMNISDASKVKNQMQLNNLDFEKEKVQRRIDDANDAMKKTGITEADLEGEEMPMPQSAIDLVQNALSAGGEMSLIVKQLLKSFKFTPERFKQVYATKNIKKALKTLLKRNLSVLRRVLRV